MSKFESHDPEKNWITKVGEAEGVHDKRVELLEYRGTLSSMLETINEDISSAFPTLADLELRPKVLRPIEMVDELMSMGVTDGAKWNGLVEELGILDFDMMRGMRAKFVQERDIKMNAIRGDDRLASEDHFTIAPEGWDNIPKH